MSIKKSLFVALAFIVFSCSIQAHAFTAEELKTYDLDRLFSLLQMETKESQARLIENQIWLSWLSAESEKIDYLMNDAYYFRREYNLSAAIDSLNEVIELVPNYSEAWNQRAIAHFYQGNLELALKDIEKTLALEPRHFGAMAGRAVIHLRMDKRDLAKQSIKEAIAIHPFLPERTLFPELSATSQK